MQSVFLDGEDVQFSGPAPASICALVHIINEHLAQNRRVLTSCNVDGADIVDVEPAQYPKDGDVVHMTSQPVAQALAQTIAHTLASTADLPVQLRTFSAEILHKPWSETLQTIDRFTALLMPIHQLTDSLHQYAVSHSLDWMSGIHPMLQANEQALNRFIEAAKCSDVATVSDIIWNEITPKIESIRQAYTDDILPHLQPS